MSEVLFDDCPGLALPMGARSGGQPGTPLRGPRADDVGLVDTTMLFAPKSGGVKRYLLAKQAWMRRQGGVRHTLVVPGARTGSERDGVVRIAAPRIPFTEGYRCPTNLGKWARTIVELDPDLIEAGDPYIPGHAALDAGEALGAPVIGFCHTDAVALASLQLGEWAAQPVLKVWSEFCRRFDLMIAPSRYIQGRLADYGVERVAVQHLGVDTELFRPDRANREAQLKRLGQRPDARLLVFAGRPSKEKNVDRLIGAVEKLGDPYRLVLIGAGRDVAASRLVLPLDHQRDPAKVAALIASCDAFVHANEVEPFGLVVLEALAAGTPVVGPKTGGVGELIDESVGQRAESSDPAHLAEAIEALFDGDLVARSKAARRRAAERHTWDSTFEGLAETYSRVLGRPLGQDLNEREAERPAA